MSEIRVDFEALGSGAQGIQATFQALQTTLQDLEQQLNPMVSSWSGDAREAYTAQKRNWEQASASMAEVLQRMGQAVGQARDNYSQTEAANRGIWQ